MKEGPDISQIAALIGDPARANILTALMAGKALTASELATEAGVTAQTASTHLARLTDGGLLVLRKQGRHRYFSLAGDEVAKTLEALMGLAVSAGHLRRRTGPRDAAMRKARICYNHLAGEMGTQLYDSLIAAGHLHAEPGAEPQLTASGHALIERLKIDLPALSAARAPLCRDCLDWSERRFHLAGSLGRALLSRMEQLGWAKRDQDTRIIRFTRQGEEQFALWFPAQVPPRAETPDDAQA